MRMVFAESSRSYPYAAQNAAVSASAGSHGTISYSTPSVSRRARTSASPTSSRSVISRFTDHDRDVTRRSLLVARVSLVGARYLRPQFGLLLCGGGPCSHLARGAVHRDLDVGIIDEVAIPVR